jgi:hypothetical protein
MDYDMYQLCVDAYRAGVKAEKREMERLKRSRKK